MFNWINSKPSTYAPPSKDDSLIRLLHMGSNDAPTAVDPQRTKIRPLPRIRPRPPDPRSQGSFQSACQYDEKKRWSPQEKRRNDGFFCDKASWVFRRFGQPNCQNQKVSVVSNILGCITLGVLLEFHLHIFEYSLSFLILIHKWDTDVYSIECIQ